MERSTCDSAARCITWVMPYLGTTWRTAGLSRKSIFSKAYLGCCEIFSGFMEMPGISEAIEIDEPLDFRAINDMMDEIGADEARAAGD